MTVGREVRSALLLPLLEMLEIRKREFRLEFTEEAEDGDVMEICCCRS